MKAPPKIASLKVAKSNKKPKEKEPKPTQNADVFVYEEIEKVDFFKPRHKELSYVYKSCRTEGFGRNAGFYSSHAVFHHNHNHTHKQEQLGLGLSLVQEEIKQESKLGLGLGLGLNPNITNHNQSDRRYDRADRSDVYCSFISPLKGWGKDDFSVKGHEKENMQTAMHEEGSNSSTMYLPWIDPRVCCFCKLGF